MEKITEKSEVSSFQDKFKPGILRQVVLDADSFEMDDTIRAKIFNMVYDDMIESETEGLFIAEGTSPFMVNGENEGKQEQLRAVAGNFLRNSIKMDWSWKSESGSFIKRLRKHIQSTVKHKLSNNCCGKIGAYVADVIPKPATYYFDFTTEFNWKAGEFGDQGSCFFRTGYEDTRYVDSRMQLQANGNFLAFRLFTKVPAERASNLSFKAAVPYNDSEHIYIGYSRSWINIEKIKQGVVALFNTYGGIKTKTAATILNAYLEGAMCDISYRNCGWYVNSDPYGIGESTKALVKALGPDRVFSCVASATKPIHVDASKFKLMPQIQKSIEDKSTDKKAFVGETMFEAFRGITERQANRDHFILVDDVMN